MNPRHYHAPIAQATARPRCPVCHEAVYSTAGIHPQCAVRQSDPPRPNSKPPGSGANSARPAGAPEPAATDGAEDSSSAETHPVID